MIQMSSKEERSIQINMLKYIDKICRENGLEYFLVGGSLIGAIRHEGFIPWDDDIDIGLTKENYDKLCEILVKKRDYLLLNRHTQKDCVYPFSKLVDSQTLLIEDECKDMDNYGVYVDIFPFYNINGDSKEACFKKVKRIKRLKKLLGYATSKHPFQSSLLKNILKSPVVIFARIIGYRNILKIYDKYMLKNHKFDSNFMMAGWPCYSFKKEVYNKEDIEKTIDHSFEGFDVKIPVGYDRVLTNMFGDYMTPPPVEKQVANHNKKIYWK